MRKSLKTMIFVVLFLGVTLLSGNHAYGQQTKVKLNGNTPTGALGRFLVQDDENQKYSELVVNLKDKKVTVNDIETTLQETLGVSKKREQILLNNTPKEFSDYIEGATECEVEKVSSDELIITNDFQTKRLIAMVDDLDETYGAINIVKGITAYILKYETDEATKEAYQKLVKKYGEEKIFYDKVYSAEEMFCSEKNIEKNENSVKAIEKTDKQPASRLVYNNSEDEYVDTAKTMGLYDINKQIDKSKYSKNMVTVVALDTGIILTTNPGCEIGNKLYNKNYYGLNYNFGNASDLSDRLEHGTAVSSVIAYNTPSNVRYGMFKIVDKENEMSDAMIYAALEQAYILDIDIVNCSFAACNPKGYEGFREYSAILKKLYEKGTVVCCGAGNAGDHYRGKDSNGNLKEYDTSADCTSPANSDYVLCISALEATKKGLFFKASYTNTGNTVDYSAIGTDVFVYTNRSEESCASGTSFSTPLVAAEFAMIKTCSDSFMTIEQLREKYDLYLTEASKKADHKIYGSGYFDLSEYELCDIKHSLCCGLWHYDGTNADIGKKHTLTIDLNGGSGFGFYSTTDSGWKDKFTRTFQCGTPLLFASAYSMEADNPNGWIQVGENDKPNSSGTMADPYRPHREGYQLVGWKCSGYGSVHKKIDCLGNKYTETWYYNGQDNEDVTLTAIWMPKKLYNLLRINPNGGKMFYGHIETTEPFEIGYRNNMYRALSEGKTFSYHNGKVVGEPIREGYSFKNWKVLSGLGAVYKLNKELADFTEEIYGSLDESIGYYAYKTLDFNETNASILAEWIPNNYTVTLKTSSDTKVAWNTVTYDNTYGAMLNFVPTRIGYTFTGWYTDERGGEKITSSSKVKIAKDHDLYAHWTPNKYKVTIKTDKDTTVAWDTVTYGQKYSPMLNFIPKKTGYTFVGWYTELYGGEQVTSSSVVRITQDQTLYAHWKNSQYKLTLRNEDKSIITTATVTYGKAYGGILSYAPEREGYTFAGWYTAITGGIRVTAKTIVSTANDHDLYIRWTKKEGE